MSKWVLRCMVAVAVAAACLALMAPGGGGERNAGLVGHYTFDEGAGDIVRDKSGNNNHGTLKNGEWATVDGLTVVKFTEKRGASVDFGKNSPLSVTGDMTVMAWVKLVAEVYPDAKTNWTIIDCEVHRKSGFIFRVGGSSRRLVYRSSQKDASQGVAGNKILANNMFYHVAYVKKGNAVSVFLDGKPDGQGKVKDAVKPTLPFCISSNFQSFLGLMDEVKIYSKALANEQVMKDYKKGAKAHGK